MKHLIDLESLTREQIIKYLTKAQEIKSLEAADLKAVLAGKTVANLFFEDSTRTRASFSLAARRLGAEVIELTGSGSSISKGETLSDTARNIEAMGVDVFVVRHFASGAASLLANSIDGHVLNAGDGQHEHPTQGLLDILTVAETLARDDFDLSGLNVAIVGDISHSRVARSNIHGLLKLGAKVTLVGPSTLVPQSWSKLGCHVTTSLDDVIADVDVINMLRIQFERIRGQQFPSIREYASLYGLNDDRLAAAKDTLCVMHPGPINRGVEISASVADGKNSVILDQVENGVIIRMAALSILCSL